MSKSESHNGSVHFDTISTQLNNLVGRVLTVVDAVVPEGQAKATKDLVKFHIAEFKTRIGEVAFGPTGVSYKVEG
jgi:hypothetical protein